ncbi:unannotated protein [freshwater metagenome]|uniref:Unannotated protein n=1 Tax=freshwater metagenome TaxID=449393 RepID=A0A6J7F8V9_9ZZZZ
MGADKLDGRTNFDLALVDIADSRCRHRLRDVARLDRPEQSTISTHLDGEFDARCLKLVFERLGLFVGRKFASNTSRTNLLDLLFATARPRNGETLRDQIITCVAVFYVDDIAGRTKAGYLIGQNKF